MTSCKQKHIFLVGLRASGKSTLGKRLAQSLALPYIDMDAALEERVGGSISSYVRSMGWETFRTQESELLQEVCTFEPHVVATGGGVVLSPENRATLCDAGLVLYLEANADTLAKRLSKDPLPGQRPPLSALPLEEELKKTLVERKPFYEDCAHITLDATLPLETLEQSALQAIEQGKQHGANS